jgi:hypothetical protein
MGTPSEDGAPALKEVDLADAWDGDEDFRASDWAVPLLGLGGMAFFGGFAATLARLKKKEPELFEAHPPAPVRGACT